MVNLIKIHSLLALIMIYYLYTLPVTSWTFISEINTNFDRYILTADSTYILLFIVTILIVNILSGRLVIIYYMLSLRILYVGSILIVRILLELENHTTFMIFLVYHTISLEWKLIYFVKVFNEALLNKYPDNSETLIPIIDLYFYIDDSRAKLKHLIIYAS